MAIIDFSKIKAKELPKKEEQINVLGTIFKVKIKPLTGIARMEYWALDNQEEADERTRKRVFLTLINSAGFTEADVFKMISLDWSAAIDLTGRIYKFTLDYESELDVLKAEAEKNFQKDSQTDTQG